MKLSSFQTERLQLRPVTAADAHFIVELVNTPKWLKYIGDRKVTNITAAEDYIKSKITSQFDTLGYGNYMVVRKEDGALLGNCGLYNRPGIEGIDIGFAFLERFEGKGYAFEASQKLLDVAFNDIEMNRVGAITVEDNTASRKLLEKLGLTFKKDISINGEDLMYYEINKEHYAFISS